MAAYQYVYVMKGLSKTYPGGKQVLKDIWLSFLPGAKIGVLGLNGAGKSTLLRIMAGKDDNFTGEAWAAEGVKVGHLSQEPELDASKDALGNVMDGVGELAQWLKRFDEVSNAFADPDADMDKLLAEQADL
ncbi:MAG: ATP-binding cassette domain-containing protein, partial [Rhodospirillales bacterium]|nr:ATP-binding cassette domain-containing protein [Rhodospirillales bacterium]